MWLWYMSWLCYVMVMIILYYCVVMFWLCYVTLWVWSCSCFGYVMVMLCLYMLCYTNVIVMVMLYAYIMLWLFYGRDVVILIPYQ